MNSPNAFLSGKVRFGRPNSLLDRPSRIMRATIYVFTYLSTIVLSVASGALAYNYQMTAIEPPGGYAASRAVRIDNLGEVVGTFHNADASGNAVNRQGLGWDATNGVYLLPTLSGESSAGEINDNRLAIGCSHNAAGKQRAVFWDHKGNTIVDIGGLRNATTGL